VTILVESFSELNRYRDLLRTWSIREIKIRYKQSLLGGLWAVLQPLSVAIIFSIIFNLFINVSTDGIPHLIFYYVALFPWTFFSNSVTTGANSIISSLHLVTKIYFPREILPLSGIIAAMLDFTIAGLLYVVLAFLHGISVGPSLILLPWLIIIQFLFTSGIVLILATLNVYYRDIRFVVPLVLQIYMYSTPLIYPVSAVPESIRPFYLLNPMASILNAYRSILAYGVWPELTYLASASLVSIILFLVAYTFFSKAARSFADII
jgi:lipopolysaccharide transport system permease protein